jgi:hypothetical protein
MAEITLDTRPVELVADCQAALQAATIDGELVFSGVIVADDVASFTRVADPLQNAKPAVGIIEGEIEQRPGTCDIEPAVCRLPLVLAIRFGYQREPGKGEKEAMDLAKRYAQMVKAALMLDPGRGGKADLVVWNAEVVNGTTVSGNVRQVRTVANQTFFAATIDAAVCWISGA